jgi:hypothetical protein
VIMEQISAMDGVSRADLKSFNRCRLFIGVIYLSEISTADGAALTREAWGGNHSRFSPLLWPFQPCPGPQSWRVWRRLLARAFLEDIPKRVTPQTKDLYLLHPLGAWLPGSDWLFRKWSYHFSPSTGQIYHSVCHTYTVHGRRRRSRHRSQLFSAAPAAVIYCLPPDCIPVEELSSSGSILAFRGMLVRRCHTKPPRASTSFRGYISALPAWDQRLLQSVEIMDDEALMNYFLTDSILYVVSDGGADDNRGSYGALLASADTIFLKISGSTEGTLPGSFRAESYGCLAILRLVYHFHLYHKLDPILCQNSFYCDNKGLISRLAYASGPLMPFPRHYLRSDMDLEMQILDTIRLLGITFTYTHVKGHQDTTIPSEALSSPLTRQAALNIECDHLATSALKLASPSATVTFLPASAVSVQIEGITVNRKLPGVIRNLIGRRLQLASFSRRYGWSDDQFDNIDWPLYCSASAKLSLKKRLFVIKWLNDLLPFQDRMHKYGQAPLAGCPETCGCESEDHSHLLRCPAKRRRSLFLKLSAELEQLYETHRVDPNLRRVLQRFLAPYWGGESACDLPPAYLGLLHFQQTLHPDSLFLGCWSTKWTTLQFNYLRLNHYPRQKGQAANGVRAIISHLLDVVHSVWMVRNSALHGDDATTLLLSYKHTQLLLDIQDLYDQSDSMLASDKSLFVHPYSYWLDKPSTELQTFLKRMRLTVKTSVEQAANMGVHFRPIDSYFPPCIPPELFDVILGKPPIPPEPD